MDAAVNALPVHWQQSEYGRATRGAAVALRGKVKLYNKDYVSAAADFEEIVKDPQNRGYGYQLYPDYAKLFTPEGDTSSEMIFAIQNMSGTGTEYGMPFSLYLGSRSSYGSGWNNCIPTDLLVDMYENRDGTKFNWEDHFPGEDTTILHTSISALEISRIRTAVGQPPGAAYPPDCRWGSPRCREFLP